MKSPTVITFRLVLEVTKVILGIIFLTLKIFKALIEL